MEKLEFVKNGVVTRLPPGFRFHPTDEELVLQYLKRKVYSHILPANIIREVDVRRSDPWDLPGNLKEERYFFSRNEAKNANGERWKRATGSGYWKATGKEKEILSSQSNQVVGMKRTLVFYRGRPHNGDRTEWIMDEYRLSLAEASKKNSTQSSAVQNWVLCRIFLRKRSTKNDHELSSICDESTETTSTKGPAFYNFLEKAPLSSSSSGVTEVSCDELSEQEESSSGNTSCSFHLTRRRLI